MSRRLSSIVLLSLLMAGSAWAQSRPQGELQFFYQHLRGFDFRSGSPSFDVRGEALNGGGLGFVYNLNDWFGLWNQTAFFGSASQGDISLKLINSIQGVQVTTRPSRSLTFYAKGGVGFTRYDFDVPGFEFVRYGSTFAYGGGLEVGFSPALAWLVEVTQMSMHLPDVTGLESRARWDSNTIVSTGLALRF